MSRPAKATESAGPGAEFGVEDAAGTAVPFDDFADADAAVVEPVCDTPVLELAGVAADTAMLIDTPTLPHNCRLNAETSVSNQRELKRTQRRQSLLWTSAGEQSFSITGVRELMYAVLLQMQA